MKKMCVILMMLCISLFRVNDVKAMELKPSGVSNGKKNEEITLYISLEKTAEEKSVSAVEGTFNYDTDVFTLVSFSNVMENWTQLSGVSNKRFSYANLMFDNLATGTNQDIVKVILKIKDDAKSGDTKIAISNPMATDENGDSVAIQGGTHTVKVLSDVNTLDSLVVADGNIAFDKSLLTYNLTVDNDIANTEIKAILTDSKSSFVEGYGSRVVNLNVGKNVVEVKIKAEDGKIKIYTMNITRKNKTTTNNSEIKSNNNYLKKMESDEVNIAFDKEQLKYQVTVLYEVEEINFELEAEDSKSIVEIQGNKNLKVGENIITITVTAEDGSIREYKITAIRKEQGQILSSNSKLKNLIVEGYNIDFASDKYIYNLKIKDEKKLNIIYIQDDVGSSVTIAGNDDLENGSVITITVVAEDQTTSTYKIEIEKNTDKNIVLLSIGLILMVLVVVYLVVRREKKKVKELAN